MFRFLRRKKLKIICFDLDNTLCDYGSAEAETEAYIANILSKEIKKKEIEILREFNAVKNKYLHHDINPEKFSRALWIDETLKNLNVSKKINSQKLEKEYWNYLTPKMKIFPNTILVLESLKKKKYRIACITDSDGDKGVKLERIRALGIEKYFDYIITTDDTGENKPSIVNWEYLLKEANVNAKECMMVGNHPDIDLLNAKKCGFVTVWTKEYLNSDLHFRYVDYEIHDIGEVLEIIKKY